MKLPRIFDGIDGKKKQLIAGVVVAVLLVCIGVYKGLTRPPEPVKAVSNEETTFVDVTQDSAITKAKQRIKARGKEHALESILEHEEAINRDWHSEDTPDRMMAIGNLYQYQLEDHYSAIQNYRNLVEGFPKHSKAPQAFIEMATCYERLGQEVQAEYIYQEMVESLDPTLDHTKFAKLKLEEKKSY